MSAAQDAQDFVERARTHTRMGELTSLLSEAVRNLGFSCVTLMHHAPSQVASRRAIAYSDYPAGYLATSFERRYFVDDPVLLACEHRAAPFSWSDLPRLVRLTDRQREILEVAARYGIAEGLTAPINVPGELPGSCSVGLQPGRPMLSDRAQAVLWVGLFAFEQARRILGLADSFERRPRLSQRELDCVVLAARGKSDWAIAKMVGLSHHTTHEYIENAKRKYGVASRQQLVAACLADGQMTYTDILA